MLRKNGKNKEADKKYQQSVRLGKAENDYWDKEERERGIHAVRKDANDNWENARKNTNHKNITPKVFENLRYFLYNINIFCLFETWVLF